MKLRLIIKLLSFFIIQSVYAQQTAHKTVEEYIQEAQKHSAQSDYSRAKDSYLNALVVSPDHINATFHLGLTYLSLDDHENAISCFRKLHALGVSSASYNLAFILRRVGHYQEAINIYENLLLHDNTNENIPFGLANAYLTVGDFEKGLPTYERGRKSVTNIPQKLEPDTDVRGKTILIIEEWGLGDTLHFIRYAKILKQRGAAKIIVCARTVLHKLLSLCPYIDQLYPIENPVRALAFDYQTPMMSLMYACKTSLENIPNEIPYLYADRDLVQLWHERVMQDQNFKIGINWKGTLDKNMNPEEFIPLTTIPGVSLYSVQKNNNELSETMKSKIITFNNFDESHGNFMDTAALMRNMDLIITVDTSIAHLAGALGIPTWILIPHWADWRWFTDKIDSPWYPTMRIFRQPALKDWKAVISEIYIELKKVLNHA